MFLVGPSVMSLYPFTVIKTCLGLFRKASKSNRYVNISGDSVAARLTGNFCFNFCNNIKLESIGPDAG